MAAPSVFGVAAGATDAGGAWSYSLGSTQATTRFLLVQIVQDGTTNGAVTAVVGTDVVDLAGASNVYTQIPGPNGDGSWPIGSPASARQFLYVGRGIGGAGVPTIRGANSTSEDLYFRRYSWQDVSTGTTLATVIENGTAGAAVNETGTGTTVSDTGVTTLGPDRLALQLVGLNDNVAIDAFTGMSGGTWTEPTGEYAEASGTDASLQIQVADMATAGTIDGGSDTIVSAGWGVVGFALIGTTSATPASFVLPNQNLRLTRRYAGR